MMYKVIFIDWDGTLSNSRFWERWSTGSAYQQKNALIQDTLFSDSRELLREWMRGLRSTDFVINYVSDSTGISYNELLDELLYSCNHMEFIDNTNIDTIQRIRKSGVKVVIATDNMDTFHRWTIPAMGIDKLFDGVITSDTQGALKSQINADGTSPFFDHYLNHNNIKPHETVLIDDSLDAQIVEKLGIDFLHINSENTLTEHLIQFI